MWESADLEHVVEVPQLIAGDAAVLTGENGRGRPLNTEAGETFQAKVRDKFWITGLRPEEQDDDVPVRFDPASKETVFDLDGDARYDVDAMNEHTAQLKAETRALKQQRPG